MRKFLYIDPLCNDSPIFIFAKRKPSLSTIPRSGAWIVREFTNRIEGWTMPCFPEITWGRVKQLKFIGEIK